MTIRWNQVFLFFHRPVKSKVGYYLLQYTITIYKSLELNYLLLYYHQTKLSRHNYITGARDGSKSTFVDTGLYNYIRRPLTTTRSEINDEI